MTINSDKIQEYYGLKPAIEFPFLSRCDWMTIPLTSGCTHRLTLYLSKSPDAGSEKEIVLDFQDVKNVQLTPQSTCVVLEIHDVSKRQWEGVNYEVRDREQGAVSFFCRDFSWSLRESTP